MYALIDTFNGRIISRHRTIDAAQRANDRLQRMLNRSSRGSYLPTVIAEEVKDGDAPGVRLHSGTAHYGVGRLRPVGHEQLAETRYSHGLEA